MRIISILIICVLALCTNHGLSSEIHVRSPNAIDDGFTITPFFIAPDKSIRYQQIYEASDFLGHGLPEEGGFITEIWFGFSGPSGVVRLENVQFSLSTTLKSPNSLSPVFSENTGSDEIVVYGPDSLIIRSGSVPSPGFNAVIELSRPFYDNQIKVIFSWTSATIKALNNLVLFSMQWLIPKVTQWEA